MLPASARAPVSAPPRGPFVALASALVVASLVGVAHHARELDRAERSLVMSDVSSAAWRTTPHALGRYDLRAGDVLRVTACSVTGGDPQLRLDARSPSGQLAFGRALTAAQSDARRCVGLRWTAPRGASLDLALVTAPAVPLRRFSLYAGPTLHARSVWPLAALALALAMLVLAPSFASAPPRPEPSLRASIFRPVADRPGAVFALLGALVGCSVFLPVLVIRALPASPVTMLLALLAQSAGFCLSAAWMLGGLDPDGPPLRDALGLGRTPSRWLLASVPIAAALVGFAMATSLWITDTSESPVAREFASSPRCLVLLFTALLAPLSEELFYRGAAQRVLGRAGPAGAVLLQALVFTALHAIQLKGALLGLCPIAAVALVNGWLRLASGGLSAPWLVHTLYNGALIVTALRGAS